MSNLVAIPVILIILAGIIFFGCKKESETDQSSEINNGGFNEFIYVGTFTGDESEGLYVFTFDRQNGTMTHLQTVTNRPGPNFQAIHPNKRFLYSVSGDRFSENEPYGTLSAYNIDQETGMLELINEQSVQGRGTAHVSVDPLGEFVYVSNYSEGNVVVFKIREDGSVTEAVDSAYHEGSSVNERRQRAAHVHSVIPSADGRFIYVSDLGIDKIKIYKVNRDTGELTPADTPYFANEPGAGPRHFVIHENGRFAYSVEELTVTVAALRVDSETGALHQIERYSLLPEGVEPDDSMSGADLHISPDGRFLYASNRGGGQDLIAIFEIGTENGELNIVGHEPTRGVHPRNFMVDEKGEYLMVANRDGDHVVIFHRDSQTGLLEFTGNETRVPVAVCVTQLIFD
ncbi:MAG: lactonase family protein [Balneolaceae bacterium]|nr:MAG: lactonase family protein [Balneolaceae bacterium]